MGIILCLETTSTNCSVAISKRSGELNAASCVDLLEDDSQGYSHGEVLHVYIEKILSQNQIKKDELDAVAISKGPGSYTGLRIGTSAAKGICYALDIPLIAIDTLQALALQDDTKSKYTIPFLDARRMEVYSSVYESGKLVELVKAIVLDDSSFLRFRESESVTFIGTGVEKFQDLINPNLESIRFLSRRPSARTMCELAQTAFKEKRFEDIAYFEPFYLKEFKAG